MNSSQEATEAALIQAISTLKQAIRQLEALRQPPGNPNISYYINELPAARYPMQQLYRQIQAQCGHPSRNTIAAFLTAAGWTRARRTAGFYWVKRGERQCN